MYHFCGRQTNVVLFASIILGVLPATEVHRCLPWCNYRGDVLVNSQFSHEVSYRQLAHATWNGWTFADTIFPGFLFIVGVSLVLSTALRMARGENCARLLAHAVRRSLLIFACGL